MTLDLWTGRRPGEPELRGRFYVSGFGPIPPSDQMTICRRLRITLTPDTFFEATYLQERRRIISSSKTRLHR
jgi:hypothetical protein